MVLLIMMKSSLFKKKIPNSRLEYKNHTLFITKMAKIDTLFMTKTPEKTLPFGAACTYIAHIRENPPPGMCTTLTDGRGGEKVGKG